MPSPPLLPLSLALPPPRRPGRLDRSPGAQITDDSSCAPDYSGEPSRFCPENVDYSDYLLLHTQGDHRAFCLAFAFTFRTFTEGVMGFAWMASGDVAGRCSGRRVVSVPRADS